MANRGVIFDPRSLQQLVVSGYFPDTALIEQVYESRSPAGGIIYSWQTVAGLDAIPCAEGIVKTEPGDELNGELVTEVAEWRVALAGYYPNITPKMRVTVTERSHVWDIISVIWDPQGVYTELGVKRVDPAAEAGT